MDDPGPERRLWEAIGDVVTAHVIMLRDAAVLDDASAAAVLTALDGVRRGDPPDGGATPLVAAFDERLDALTSARAPGVGALGRGRTDTAATAGRVVLRTTLLDLLAATDGLRLALLDLAEAHVFTLMPAYGEGRPLQPTTLAHYLGGVIGPVGRAAARLRVGFAEGNRSPMGAVALASTGVNVDREAVARMLGFDGPVVSTFDAVSAIDHLAAALDPAAAVATAAGRFLTDLQTWLRAEPGSVRIAPRWLALADASLPHFLPAAGLDRLVAEALAVASDAAVAGRLAAAIPYGPVGAAIDRPTARTLAVLAAARSLAVESTALVGEGLEINRAHFAGRAGRDHVTTGELAALLVEQEGLDPAAARALTAAVANNALDLGLEASGITPQAIDAAALLTIGRELGIEIERLGPYLAPRRFLERRTALGAPSPASTRDWLELERTRVLADERWRDETAARIRESLVELEREVSGILSAEEAGGV
ncbi:MAG: hypothetical protein H0U10_00775 [Chloroflexia bacterium]|nr:hypothetical protein [Chloroflexia bacterium]